MTLAISQRTIGKVLCSNVLQPNYYSKFVVLVASIVYASLITDLVENFTSDDI